MEPTGLFRCYPRRALEVQSSEADYHMNCPKLPCFLFTLVCFASMAGALSASILREATDWNSAAASSAEAEPDSAASAAGDEEPGSTALTNAPPLTISRSQGQLSVRWALTGNNWVLEQAANLTPPIPWAPVSPLLYQTNATNLFITTALPAGNAFYRLRKLVQAVTVPGLAGAWSFDASQSQVAEDSSGHTNSASLTNVTWAAGRIGPGALWFNGAPAGVGASLAWVSNANYAVLPPPGQPFSVSMWINPDALTNGWSGLIGTDANGSNGWHLALQTTGPGTNQLVLAASGLGAASLSVTGRVLLLPGRWYSLAATYDGSEGIIYLDSELIGRATGALLANDQPIYFGGGVANFRSFLGRIDEVRAYTNALTPEAISLAGQWHFDENSGDFTTDSSLHGHPASVSNPAAWDLGKDGSGINLSHSTVFIPNDYSEVLPLTGGSFSISMWLYPNSIGSDWSGLMSCAAGTNTGWSLALAAGTAGQTQLHFWSTNSGGTLDLMASLDLDENMWSKLDITYNGGIATVYLDGRKIKSDSGGIQGNTAPLVVGTVPGTPNFDGIIDELNIYSRERSETEIGPVARVMWETALLNTSTNLALQGSGPPGKPLTYEIVGTLNPTNGTVTHTPGSPIVTYTAGTNKGPDAFAYTVSDGEFTSPPATVTMSVVQPHWLSTNGGTLPPLDGSSPEKAWVAGPSVALDAIWHTNQYYDCFFYAPGEFQTTGWKYGERGTVYSGCKHIGAGSGGLNPTTLKLVNTWDPFGEGVIFSAAYGEFTDGFEIHDLVLDCNAENNPKYAVGEPVSIVIPLVSTGRVDTVTLHWHDAPGEGPAQNFSVCTRAAGINGYATNCHALSSTGEVDTVAVGAETDEIIVRLERRASGVDFYGLEEIEVAGEAAVSLVAATVPGGGESRLISGDANYSILQAVDGDNSTVWASGPENQVQIVLPLQSVTAVSQLALSWNCHLTNGVGQLGPAADYYIQARDPNTGQLYDVPFVRQQRTTNGVELSLFGTAQSNSAIVTGQLIIQLTAKELGVDFYSLREVTLQNGATPVPLKLPTAQNNTKSVLRAFDGDANTEWAGGLQGMVGAIAATGNNLKFTHLKVIGFGTKAWRECFPLVIYTPLEWQAGPAAFGNVVLEDCLFSEPATHNADGLTTVTVAPFPSRTLTNAAIRRCTVSGVKPYFTYSDGFTAVQVENCQVDDCGAGIYFEPDPTQRENVGSVLIRSNVFLNVNQGVVLQFRPNAQFDSLTCVANEIVLSGVGGSGVAACDTCSVGASGSMTSLTVLNNLVRYADWSVHPENFDVGLVSSDIHNAVFGNNLIVLGTPSAIRVRPCPAGIIYPPPQMETCDFVPLPPPLPPTYPPCLDVLPAGYRRGWFNNRDLQGNQLKVKISDSGVVGLAAQQQWP